MTDVSREIDDAPGAPDPERSVDDLVERALTNAALAQRKVAELMTRTILTVRPDQTVQDAIDLFARQEFHHTLVADGTALVGVISDRDVLRALLRSQTTIDGAVSKIMRASPFTTCPGSSIGEATRLFLRHRINSLPVVDECGALVGILTTTDLLRTLLAVAGER